MVKKSRVAAALVCLVLGLALLGSAAFAADTKVTVADSADTYTQSNTASTDYGTSTSLGVYGTPSATAVIRFVLPAAPAGKSLTAATLRVRTTTLGSAGSVNAANVRVATDTWTETGTTYAKRPTPSGAVLGSLPGGSVPDKAYSIALSTAALAGLTGSTTLAIEGTGTDSLFLSSRQVSTVANRPALDLTYTDTAPGDTTPPSTPGDPAATVNGISVSLAWTASSDAVGVTGYTVHRSTTTGFTPSAATVIGTVGTPGFTDQGRPAGTWYYRVVATDAASNASDPSATATAVVGGGPPTQTTVSLLPQADTYTQSNTPSTDYGTSTSLGVYGTPVVTSVVRFVLPSAPSGTTLTGAALRVRTTAITSAGSANPATVRIATDTWTETGTTYANRPTASGGVLGTLPGGTTPDKAYSIPLSASALAGLTGSTTLALEGSGSDSLFLWSRQTATATNRPALDLTYTAAATPPDSSPPTAPTDLAATVSGSAVTLTWTAAEDDQGVTGYVVHRSADADFTPSPATAVGATSGTTTTDAARPPGTWYFRVVAQDAAGNAGPPSAAATATVVDDLPPTMTVAAAGDIVCPPGDPVTPTTCKHVEVRALIDSLAPDRFIAVGDLAQGNGSYDEFVAPGRFADTFGSLGSKILPVMGNHEGFTPQAAGYWDYFYGPGVTTGPFGDRPTGYYTTMIGSWRFIGLNSECDPGGLSGGCDVTSPQYQWLKSLLEQDTTACTVVAYHRPRWTTGSGHPPYVEMAPLWDLLAQHHADIVLSGHNHVAEAFKPIGVSGTAAQPTLSPQGIRSFTVGIGGDSQYTFSGVGAGQFSALESRAKGTFGVLKLSLKPGGYDWGFLPIAGSTFTNSGTTGSFSGTDSCH
jgi:hypothetical protein